jgi:hypothetical protein
MQYACTPESISSGAVGWPVGAPQRSPQRERITRWGARPRSGPRRRRRWICGMCRAGRGVGLPCCTVSLVEAREIGSRLRPSHGRFSAVDSYCVPCVDWRPRARTALVPTTISDALLGGIGKSSPWGGPWIPKECSRQRACIRTVGCLVPAPRERTCLTGCLLRASTAPVRAAY